MSNEKRTERLIYLDIARGIALLFVITGHALLKSVIAGYEGLNYFRSCIYVVHMPIFFVISGILFEINPPKKTSGHYIIDKLKLYLVPYVSYSFLLYIVSFIGTHTDGVVKKIVNNIGFTDVSPLRFIYTLLTFDNHPDTHLWFVYVMFTVLILATLMYKVKLKIILLVSSLLYVLTYYVSSFGMIEKIVRFYFLFSIGRVIAESILKIDLPAILTVFIGGSGALAVFLSVLIREPIMVHIVLKLYAEVGGPIFIIQVGKIIFKHKNNVICKGLNYIGVNSYPVYLIHQPYITPIIVIALTQMHVPVLMSVMAGIVGGLLISLLVYKYVIRKVFILRTLFVGGR